ncbi:Pycsar system effector family protein [Streptomyces malaysiensis]
MSTLDASLATAHAEVKAEIARTDGKASLLLAFIGAVLAGVWTVASDAHLLTPVYVVGGLGVLLLVTAAALLLRVVRPNMSGAVAGFPLWARLTGDEIRALLAEDRRGDDIANLSRIAMVKFAALQRAIDVTRAAGALLVVAAGMAVGGAL